MVSRRTLTLAILGTLASSGCMNGPVTGQIYDGDGGTTAQQKVGLYGFYTAPGHTIIVQALKSQSADPTVDGNWVKIGETTTGTTAYHYNDPTDMFLWQLDATPGTLVVNGVTLHPWASGGLARVRAQAVTENGTTTTIDTRLTSFDEDFTACQQQFVNSSWETIEANCRSHYSPNGDVATLVSTTARPSTVQAAQSPASPYLTMPGGPGAAPSVGQAYYDAAGISVLWPNLPTFKLFFGFGLGNASEAQAVYYNAGDLGIGREMHCIVSGANRACYVTNYADRLPPGNDPKKRVFAGNDASVNDALADAVKGIQGLPGTDPIATVAIVEETSSGTPNVLFMVYDAGGNLLDNATLDASAHPNTQVPTNCLSCHAGNGSISGGTVANAHFLPFDLDSFRYSSDPNFTESAQLEQFRKLNAVVQQTGHSQALTDLLEGWYPPNGPQTGAATFNGDFIPSGWSYRPATEVYQYGIKKYCRTCHLGQTITDFATAAQLTNLETAGHVVTSYLCDQHLMPQALVTQNNFWNSSARAHILGFLGAKRDCAP